MSFRRPCVLLTAVVAACATATSRQQQATSDASAGQGDGPSGGEGLPPHIDAAIDAPPGSCTTPFSGALATWSFNGEPGNQAQTAATNMAAGVTPTAVSRSAGLTVQMGSNSINSTGWPTAAVLDSTKYYTFSVTPPSGCVMDLTQLSIDLKASGSGPTKVDVATSDDTFTRTSPATPNVVSTPALSVTGASSSVEVRVYGYTAATTTGTLRIQTTLSITGTLR